MLPAESSPERRPSPPPLPLSVIVCVHNEEGNLAALLRDALAQAGPSFRLEELIAVASGCTDRSTELLAEASRRDPRVRTILQPTREGKLSAVDLALRAARTDLLVFENADTRPAPGAYEEAASRFRDPRVELVAFRPVPTNRETGFVVRMGRALWEVHDAVSRISPKVGEAYAIRRSAAGLPAEVDDNDTFLSAELARPGGRVYADRAVVFNRVPTTLAELYQQRQRIGRLVLGLRRRSGLTSVTWDPIVFLRGLSLQFARGPRRWPELLALTLVETGARLTAFAATALSPAPLTVWDPIDSTKRAVETAAGPPRG